MKNTNTRTQVNLRLIICIAVYLLALLVAWEMARFVSESHTEISPGATYFRLIPLAPAK